MNKKAIFILLILFIFFIGIFRAQEKSNDFPVLKGPYLGQTEPGMKPEIFAPGIVSTEQFREFSGTFTPDGKEYYFFRFADSAGMMVCKFLDEGWKRGNHSSIAPDGNYLFFCNRGDIYWVSIKIIENLKPKELRSK